MNKFFTFKCLVLVAFTLMGFKAQAQTYYVEHIEETKVLLVDTKGPDGSSPDGTAGSWYRWNPNAGFTTTANYTAGDDPDGSGLNDSNKADISWNATWPTAPARVPTPAEITSLIKDYKVTAEEFNSCQPTTSTETSKTEIDVKLVKPDILFIDADSDVCSTAKAYITLYGTPEAVVNYIINDGAVTDGGTDTSATFNTNGEIVLEITPDGTTDVQLVISEVQFTSPSISQNPGKTFSSTTITATAGKTITIPLSAGPVISEIEFF